MQYGTLASFFSIGEYVTTLWCKLQVTTNTLELNTAAKDCNWIQDN